MPTDRALPGFRSPEAGFEVPLEMLAACHHRIERQLRTLRRLPPHLHERGADDQAREAARAVLRYFDLAAPQHHADEEADLFPALLESMAGSDAVCLRQLTETLSAEHRLLEAHWQRLRPGLQALAEGSPQTIAPGDVEALAALYERHIAREEAELLPLAARLLGDEALDTIGVAMRRRRGIEVPD